MKYTKLRKTKNGFKCGDAKVERILHYERDGWIILCLETSKHELHINIKKSGNIRIYDENGLLWSPQDSDHDATDDEFIEILGKNVDKWLEERWL